MNKDKSKKILAIDPGTREMGVAFFDNKRLIYHTVKTTSDKKTPHEKLNEVRNMVLRFINDFKPDLIAIEKTFFANNRNASLLNVLGDEIEAIAKIKNVRVVSYAPNTVKKEICGYGHAEKKKQQEPLLLNILSLKFSLTKIELGRKNIIRICLMRWH